MLAAPAQGQSLPSGDPFAELAKQIDTSAENEPDMAVRFAQAHVGYLAYDLVHFTTKVDRWPVHQPLARFMSDATVVVFDNLRQTVTIASSDQSDIERAEHDLEHGAPLRSIATPDPLSFPTDIDVLMDDATYERKAEQAKEYIRAGDAFQLQLGRTMVANAGATDPFDVYRALRVLSPSPYMYFLDFPASDGVAALQIAGASPETLVRVENEVDDGASARRHASPRAHAGRRFRALDDELLADPEGARRARDAHRSRAQRRGPHRARRASVRVPLKVKVERFSHVMHIVSEVCGKVRPDSAPWDVIRAAFPAGTLTGTPKVRAMQIIRELELRARGIYGGAVGYVGPSRDLDIAIAIRTILCQGGQFEITAAAGIVEGSIPALEAKETRNKARAGLAAIRAARGR